MRAWLQSWTEAWFDWWNLAKLLGQSYADRELHLCTRQEFSIILWICPKNWVRPTNWKYYIQVRTNIAQTFYTWCWIVTWVGLVKYVISKITYLYGEVTERLRKETMTQMNKMSCTLSIQTNVVDIYSPLESSLVTFCNQLLHL